MKILEYVPEYHHQCPEKIVLDEPEARAWQRDDGSAVVVQWTLDIHGYEYLQDSLGSYTSEHGEGIIDREKGILLGEGDPEPEMDDFLPEQYKQDAEPYVVDSEIPDDVWAKADEDCDEAWDKWNYTDGYGEDACWLTTRRDDRSYRYFKTAEDYMSHSWSSFSNKSVLGFYNDKLREMKKYDIPMLADVEGEPTRKQAMHCLAALYIVQDYERMEAYEKGDWCLMTCWAYLYRNEEQVEYAVCGGMPSDASPADIEQLEKELIEEVCSE